MALTENDPVYYKSKLNRLVEKAKKNGILIIITDTTNGYSIGFENDIKERASVQIECDYYCDSAKEESTC